MYRRIAIVCMIACSAFSMESADKPVILLESAIKLTPVPPAEEDAGTPYALYETLTPISDTSPSVAAVDLKSIAKANKWATTTSKRDGDWTVLSGGGELKDGYFAIRSLGRMPMGSNLYAARWSGGGSMTVASYLLVRTVTVPSPLGDRKLLFSLAEFQASQLVDEKSVRVAAEKVMNLDLESAKIFVNHP